MSSQHSIIASSAASVWGAPNGCPGYVTAAQMWPEIEESEAAKEGSAAHWVAEQMLRPQVGSTAPNGVIITEEMYAAAEMYIQDVLEVFGAPQVNDCGLEERLSSSARIHPEQFGTCDAWALNRATFTLYVWDFKYGRRYVSAHENWQLICYVAGLLQHLGIEGDTDQQLTVRMRIVQPRAYGPEGAIREWCVTASELRGHFNTLRRNAELALSATPTYRAGAHCRYCPARGGRCQAALDAGFNLYEASTEALPKEIDPVSLGTLLATVEDALQQLQNLQTGLAAQALHAFKSGQNIPGYSPKETQSRLQWDKSDAEVEALGKLLNVDLVQRKPITPTQAMDKYGVDPSIINVYCSRKQTGVKLVRDTKKAIERLFK